MTEHYEVTFRNEELENTKSFKFAASVYDIFSSVIMAVVFVAVALVFFFRVATVEGTSMVPTLENNDKLIITSVDTSYEYGDIVVIHRENKVSLVKRVIARGGDTVDIDFDLGVVTVNGEVLDEPYIAEPTYLNFSDGAKYPFVVPEGFLFCMGDNRNNSLDSRSASVGLINEQYVIGKMVIDLNNKEAK